MRKKATKSDIFYIENHDDTPEDISKEIGLSLTEVVKYMKPKKTAKKKAGPNLGKSKVKLKHGQSVYQLTDDIDVKPTKTPNTKKQDEQSGIYRG